MAAIDFLFQENVAPSEGLATDRFLLGGFQRASRPPAGVLRVYTTAGSWLSAGRYQRIPEQAAGIVRRLSGGRAVPFGDGFVGFSLLLPHRSALVANDPLALSPYQVPNRFARGVLRALRHLGLEAFYPGRDLLTVERRVVGMVSFETDERGALVFEGVLGVARDFGVLPELRSRLDAEGVLQDQPLEAGGATSIGEEIGERLSPRSIAEALRRGFAEHFHIEVIERDLSKLEEQAISALAVREFGEPWRTARPLRSDLPLFASLPTTLGVLEVSMALEQHRFIREVQLSGAFVANACAIERLERELRLCPAEWRAIAMIADQIFGDPRNYVLGIGKLRTIPDVITAALPA